MISDIMGMITEIPGILEAGAGLLISYLLNSIAKTIVSAGAEASVCQMPGLINWILCFYMTHLGLATVITIGIAFTPRIISYANS